MTNCRKTLFSWGLFTSNMLALFLYKYFSKEEAHTFKLWRKKATSENMKFKKSFSMINWCFNYKGNNRNRSSYFSDKIDPKLWVVCHFFSFYFKSEIDGAILGEKVRCEWKILSCHTRTSHGTHICCCHHFQIHFFNITTPINHFRCVKNGFTRPAAYQKICLLKKTLAMLDVR